MVSLTQKKCTPAEEGVQPLEGDALETLHEELGREWHVVHEHHLEKEFHFKNFSEALSFTNQVGELAEKEKHHPDIHLAWGKVRVVLWTHNINGLSESDFILAAKIDLLLRS